MSIRKLSFEDNINEYFIKEYSSDSDKVNLNYYLQILSNKNIFHITNHNHTNHIEIKPSSLKNIFIKGELEPTEHTLFCFYQDVIPPKYKKNKENIKNKKENHNHKNKLRGAKRKKNENKENEKQEINIEVSSPEHLIQENENEDNNNNNIYLSTDNDKNENNFDPELDLLNGKSNENLIRNKKQKGKYIISFFNNTIKITNDNIKCFYLCLLFCGLIYTIYFLDVLIDKNKILLCLFNIFCSFMAILLIVTGLYGYYKINEKIYDDKSCIILTYSSFISPFLNCIFSRFSTEENVRKNIIIGVFVNIITAIFSGICIYILNSLQGKNKKGLLFEKINIV